MHNIFMPANRDSRRRLSRKQIGVQINISDIFWEVFGQLGFIGCLMRKSYELAPQAEPNHQGYQAR